MDIGSRQNFGTPEVYELATDIASEFEHLIDNDTHDAEALNPLVLKVIRVLESLEACAINLETLRKDLVDLKHQNYQLQVKKNAFELERTKLEQDFEELHDGADKETKQLKSTILKLKKDNKRLKDSVQEHISLQVNDDIPADVIKKLQHTVVVLRGKLEEKDSEIQIMTDNVAELQLSVKELTDANKALCCKVFESQKKVQNFHKDESDLQQQLCEQKAMLKDLQQSLTEATQQKLDWEESYYSNQTTQSCSSYETEGESLMEDNEAQLQRERENLLAKIRKLEDELSSAKTESEFFRNQCLELQMPRFQKVPGKKKYNIRQLFHLVLGVAPVSRSFRSY